MGSGGLARWMGCARKRRPALAALRCWSRGRTRGQPRGARARGSRAWPGMAAGRFESHSSTPRESGPRSTKSPRKRTLWGGEHRKRRVGEQARGSTPQAARPTGRGARDSMLGAALALAKSGTTELRLAHSCAERVVGPGRMALGGWGSAKGARDVTAAVPRSCARRDSFAQARSLCVWHAFWAFASWPWMSPMSTTDRVVTPPPSPSGLCDGIRRFARHLATIGPLGMQEEYLKIYIFLEKGRLRGARWDRVPRVAVGNGGAALDVEGGELRHAGTGETPERGNHFPACLRR